MTTNDKLAAAYGVPEEKQKSQFASDDVLALLDKLQAQNAQLVEALKDMTSMHDLMMKQANHGASFYQSDCLQSMNEAPLKARALLADIEKGKCWMKLNAVKLNQQLLSAK